jgi:type I restriction enzyme S subunit
MKGLPTSWSSPTLLECSQFVRGVTYTKSDASDQPAGGLIPIVRANNIQARRFDFNDLVYLPENLVSGEQALKGGDVVVATSSGSISVVGKAAQVLHERPMSFGAFCGVLRPSPFINARYFGHFFSSKTYRDAVSNLARGVNINNLKRDHFQAISLPLAPLAEQKRIADKLDTVLTRVDAVNARLARVAPILKRFRQSVLAAATSGRLTEDWRATAPAQSSANELAQYLSQRAKTEKKPPAQPDMAHWRGAIPANWTIASVHQFAECLDRLRVPIKRDQRQSKMDLYPYYGANGEVGRIDQFIFDDELVLVTEDETFYGREKPIAYRSSGKCWVNNHAHVLRAPSKAANDYLCFSLMYYDVIPWLSGTTGRAKLTQQALNSLPIAVPPALEISEIVRRVETLFAFADRLEARLQTAQTAADRLTPSLLAKAFRGELVPQDPNDEPASELLKRLAASATTSPTRRGRSKASMVD